MSHRIFSILAALHFGIAAVFRPSRFATTSWDSVSTPGVRVYFASSNRTGIQQLASDGDSNANPNTYKTWQSSVVLPAIVTAVGSDFAAVNSNGQNILVFFERESDDGNGATSLASAQWTAESAGWSVGGFSAPAGSFRQGTRIAAAMLASGQISVFFQDDFDVVYETTYDGSRWSGPLVVDDGGDLTELATCVRTDNSTGPAIEKMFLYMRRDEDSSQIYEYLRRTNSSIWDGTPVLDLSTAGNFAIVNIWGTSSLYFPRSGDGSIGQADAWQGAWYNIHDLAGPSNAALGSDISATVQIVNGREWVQVFLTGLDGTLWQDSYTWTGIDNSDWTDPFQLTI